MRDTKILEKSDNFKDLIIDEKVRSKDFYLILKAEARRTTGVRRCRGASADIENLQVKIDAFCQYKTRFFPAGEATRIDVKITWRADPIHTITSKINNKSNSFLPIDVKVPIIAREGFDNDLYHYEYATEKELRRWRFTWLDDYNWEPLPAKFQQKQSIEVSAEDVLGSKARAEEMIGKPIYFRVVSYDKDTGLVCSSSEVLPLTVTQAAPFITIKNIQSPLCNSNETTATVTIQLSRKLLGSLEQYRENKGAYLGEVFEKLSFSEKDAQILGKSSIGVKGLPKDLTEYFLQHDHIDNVVLRTASVTTNYEIDIMGYFYYLNNNRQRDRIQLYTDDAQHKGIFTITVPKPLIASAFPTDNKCFGDTKGKIEVRVLGGTPPYKYVKNDEPPVTVGGNSFFLTNLPTGTYTLTITDKNDCQILKNGKVSPVVVKIGGPAKPITIVNEGEPDFVKHVSGYKRSNGSITTIITGGTPKKNDLLEYTVKIESDKGIKREISLYETDSSIRGFKSTFEYLDAGTYTLTIIDGNDCTLTRKITITEPDELIINSIEATPISCNPRNSDPNNNSSINSNGTLTVNAKGGVPTYRYVWKRFNKPYTETRDKTITDLVDGIYQVEVIDANENKAVGTYTLTYPDPLYLKVTKSEMTCSAPNGGQATAIVSGGTPPYTYLWNTGHSGAHITGLSAGKYFVTVSDSRGCSVQEKVVLSYPEEVEVNNAIITPVTCYEGNDGKIALTLSGGKGNISVSWYDAQGNLLSQRITNGGKTINGLKAGKYKAVFRDQSDCPALEQFYEVLQPEKTVINIPSQITICQGDSRSFDLSTAFPSATFRWTDSTGSLLSTEPTFTVSTKGNYKVEITDQKGCKEVATFEVSQSDKILEVDFLAATNSYYNYTVKLVSLSHSITTQWVLPREVTLIKEENGAAEVRFPNEGTYTIGLKGFLDGCEKTVYKTLWVEKDRLGIGKENTSKEVLIDDFGIFSNPNNGTFRIKVNLKRASAIKVYCIDILGREAFPAIEQPEGTTFDIPIENRRISAGQYLVILEAGGDVMVQKMIVNH
ncbi:Por secretion system C-terminal sorting domain protein [Capnocytophaga sp. oral taxon 412 str. F0487]|uniref:SprB repeat-containing protein n=1 Tax=Capnocytophaga sp. oral taxon 412 TaxID=712218 RepID=UPI0002696642|nr:SprB repeat-containing protein [Capnocytophaga sp. oral taxon 412]EIW91026.1 Por secretion system C-terminal sorting domain protein [Capnocytophaga sp. oral taxon 412 str. F0487]